MKRSKIEDANMAALAAIAQTGAEIAADAAVSDDGVPQRLRLLAIRVNESTSERVTAIKRANHRSFAPASPVADLTEWHMRRMIDAATMPPAIEVNRDAWYFIVHGNPVAVESWLREEGYPDAFAGSPNSCMVMFA